MTNLNPRPNPYVGPRAFQTGEKLHGRDREVRELLDLLIAERIVLLHSPSGAGKSSLVQAGLLPALEDEGFEALPPIRVNQEPPASLPIDGVSGQINRYTLSALLSLEAGTSSDTPLEQLTSLTLDEYLEQHFHSGDQEQADDESLVLIFDQFEEVLTVDATDHKAKMAFFDQLGHALRERHRWALFVMREDYMAALDPYLRPLPTRLDVTYRLDNLGVNAARQAIQQPVVESGVDFLPGVVNKLVDDLREVQVQQSDGTMEVRPGPYIEPVQLQVVCYHLWDQLPADKMEISEDDLSAIGNVDQSLADYYAQQVAMIAKNADVKERRIRNWFEHQLITEGGIRGQERKKPDEKSKLENHAIKMLEDAHLIRAEKRLGATWFELAHDRLIQPVRVNNDTWFLENLSLLQRQASLWEQENRSDTLYLRDEALAEAEVWAAENPQEVSPTDQAFLDASLVIRAREEEAHLAVERERQMKLEAAQKVAEAERLRAEEQAQAASELRRRAYILGSVLVIALFLAGFAAFQRKLASDNAAAAENNAIMAENNAGTAQVASTQANDNAARAEGNAATAQAAREEANANAAIAEANEARAQAASILAKNNAATAEANEIRANVNKARAEEQSTLAQSSRLALQSMALLETQPDTAALMSVRAFRTADTWEAKKALLHSLPIDQQPLIPFGQPIPIQANSVDSVAMSPDGGHIAWGRADGEIVIWDYRNHVESQRYQIHQYRVKGLDFSPGGDLLVSGGEYDGQMVLWDVVNQIQLADYSPETIFGGVRSLSFHPGYPEEPYIAAAIGSQVIYLEVTQNGGETDLVPTNFGSPDIKGAIYSVEWSPNGEWLAAASADTSVYVWNPRDDNVPTESFDKHEAIVRSIDWSPDSSLLASADEQGKIYLWEKDSGETTPPMQAYTQVYSLAFSADGKFLASGGQDNKIVLWDIQNGEKLIDTRSHSSMVVDLDFSPIEGEYLLASASYDRTIGMHEILNPQPHSTYITTYPDGPLISLAIDGNETLWLASPTEDLKTIQVLDSTDLTQPIAISIPITATSFALSLDGAFIAIAGVNGEQDDEENGVIRILDLENGDVVSHMTKNGGSMPGYIYSLAYSADGSQLASSHCLRAEDAWDGEPQCELNEIWLWDISSGELKQTILTDHTDFIYALAFNTDGGLIASGSEDQSIRVRDLESPETIKMQLLGHTDRVISLAFSPDGATLASGGMDKTLLLWDIATRQPIGELVGENPEDRQATITSLIYAPNGENLYSGDSQGALYAWDVNFESWLERACDRSRPNLTDAEWDLYFPEMARTKTDQEFRNACDILSAIQSPASTPTPTATPTPTPTP